MTTNVRHLRAMPRPYDHERDDIAIAVALTPLEWSVLIAGAERSPIADCRSVAARVAAEVMRVQRLRFAPDEGA